MTNEELQQAIITVMVFDGWFSRKSDTGIIYWSKEGQPITSETQLVEDTCYHTSWRLLHPIWEKFRDMLDEIMKMDLSVWLEYCRHRARVSTQISFGTPLEAFTALHSAIVWFNEIK